MLYCCHILSAFRGRTFFRFGNHLANQEAPDMTKTVENPALHIQHNGEADLYQAKIRENNMYFDNGKVAKFDHSSVFTVRDHLHKTGLIRKRPAKFKMVIYLDGKGSCAKMLTGKELEEAQKKNEQRPDQLQKIPDSQETLLEPLTDQDREVAVKRMILKALAKAGQEIKPWMFLVLLGVEIATIIIGLVT